MSTLTFKVDGMTCGHCTTAVTKEVESLANVTAVDIDLDTKLVVVTGNDLDVAAITAAIDEAGFDAVPA